MSDLRAFEPGTLDSRVIAAVAPVLATLHWLPVRQRVIFKTATLEPGTGTSIARTIAVCIQAPAQDPLVCSSTRLVGLLVADVGVVAVVRRCCDCTASSAPTTSV